VRTLGTFRGRLTLVALLALGVRTLATLHYRDYPVIGDALTFHLGGGFLADGQGFRRVFEDLPTAEHPPGMWVLVAAFHLLGADAILAQKLLLGLTGTFTVVLTGLLARRVAGDRAGLLAAVIAAVHPLLWLADTSLMSESLYGVWIVLAVLLAYRHLEAPSAGRAAAVGAVAGLATLTRGEALALVPLLAVVLLAREHPPARTRVTQVAAMVAGFAVVLAPWTVRNAVTFSQPVAVSTNGNAVFAGSNCDQTYYGPIVGLWHFPCYGPAPGGDESEQAVVYRRRGLDYARAHAARLPLVLAARLGRVWDVYRPGQTVFYETTEGRPAGAERWGVRLSWLLMLLAAAGLVALRRRGVRVGPLLVPVVMVSMMALLTYGSTRFRFAAEPMLVVLGAVALDAAARAARARRAVATA
jgi:4-amino-4-deoxy-L-arabinose transferase-like glycosyltransferase